MKVKGQGQKSGAQRLIFGARLCRVHQRAKKIHYQSEVFVCVSTYHADTVDRLSMLWWTTLASMLIQMDLTKFGVLL